MLSLVVNPISRNRTPLSALNFPLVILISISEKNMFYNLKTFSITIYSLLTKHIFLQNKTFFFN